jgi:hypothetical protein
MKKTIGLGFLCLLTCLGAAQAQLKIDFNVTGGAVQEGWQGYFAADKNAASFTAQSYSAFGTTVTIQPTWSSGAAAECMRMIDRGTDDGLDVVDLLKDWIGTDTRQVGDPMTLTISGLPAGTYEWLSYHHDAQDQTGIFSVTVNDAMGSTTTADIDISNTQGTTVNKLEDVTTFSATIVSSGRTDVTLVFDQTSASSVVADAIFVMNAFELTAVNTGGAMVPSPAVGETDVPRDGAVLSWMANPDAVGHDVYLGLDAAAIENATTADPTYQGSQDDARFAPGRLELDQTYYWRVDEVLADGTTAKGSVWSFTVEPTSIALTATNITATASTSNSDNERPEKTIDGSGLSDEGLHSVETTDMWLTDDEAGPAWIQYQFDGVYKLHRMLVWNYNAKVEPIVGMGGKTVTIEHSTNGAAWTTVDAVGEFAQAPGEESCPATTTVDFGGAAAQYVRITIADNWGGMVARYGLSEVRFLVIPAAARLPQPQADATHVDPRSTLSWRAGRDAAKHLVYLSTDANEVTNGTALVATVSETQFDAGGLLALGKTYYWKVDEVNDLSDPAAWSGEVWSFSSAASLPVDDMESYNDNADTGTRIYEIWVDGWEDPANGSQVGNDEAPFAELATFHGGLQAMPLRYDNSEAGYSEATRAFDEPQDWTQYGVQGLTLWLFGDPANTAGQLYVKVNGKKVVYDGDADNLQRKPWQMWYVALSDFAGVNLAKVTDLTIGVENGGQGTLLIDDIALSPLDRQLVTPVAPAAESLVLRFAFDGNMDDDAGAYDGVAAGAPTYAEGQVGQAIVFDGVRDYITATGTFDLTAYTATIWFRVDGGVDARDILTAYNPTGYLYGILLEVTADGQLRYLHRSPVAATGGANLYSNASYDDGAWHHVAIVQSGETMALYVNGVQVASAAASSLDLALEKIAVGVLRSEEPQRFFPGALDDLYLYNRALSDSEIASLAGRTQPFDKP